MILLPILLSLCGCPDPAPAKESMAVFQPVALGEPLVLDFVQITFDTLSTGRSFTDFDTENGVFYVHSPSEKDQTMVWLTATLQNRTDTSFLLTPENAKVRFIFHGRYIDPGELFQLRGEPLKSMDYTVDNAVYFCAEVPESLVEESHTVTIQLGFNELFDECAGRQDKVQ